ncbi:MAG: SDR family oxidoreductase [Candidatus Hodarchaeales archaeon]|jgi:NAD(P)-dependent dehydrogenase (short-subunit alcohol dehydrogenase family)
MKRNILITGANRGLGLALTKIFLENGNTVFVLYRSMSDALKELRGKFNDNLLLFEVDVTKENDIKSAFSKIENIISSIDILINNAAVHLENHRPNLEKTDFEAIVNTFEVNSIAPLKVIKLFIPLVKNSQRKLIVNISSEAGSIGTQTWRESEYGYCMSKAALNMMSKLLHNRFKKDGVKILAVHPGWFSSDMGGSEAPITPSEAANNVAKIILKDWKIDDHIFVDFEAKPMKW